MLVKNQFKLCAFPDSSKQIYGCVLYLVNITTGEISFLTARNKLVSKQLQTKSVPCLELQGITLGVETLIDTSIMCESNRNSESCIVQCQPSIIKLDFIMQCKVGEN